LATDPRPLEQPAPFDSSATYEHASSTSGRDEQFFAPDVSYGTRPRREFQPEEIINWLRGQLGPSIERRGAPALGKWLSAVGGALLAVGGVIFSSSLISDSGATGGASVVIVLVLAAGVAALATAPPPLVPAAVAMTLIAAPALGGSIVAGSDDPSAPLAALITLGILGVLYFVGPSRGHSAHLGGLAAAVAAAGMFVSGANADSLNPEGVTTSIAAVSIACAGAFLVTAYWLDGYDLKGMATPLYLVGGASLAIGLATVMEKSRVVGGIATVAIAAAILVAAIDRRRRGMLWFGAFGALAGVVSLGFGIAPEDDGQVVLGISVAMMGLVVALISTGAERAVDSFHETRTWGATGRRPERS
jgi:hypothetical protein